MFTVEEIQSLNELEMQVYQYVIQHKTAVSYMRIRELAAEAYVSPTTVLRFCKKMGCDGYTEFKWKMKEYIGQTKTKVLSEDSREIRVFFDEIESGKYNQKLEKAAAMIAKEERVLVAGIGNSGNIGQYGARYFTNMGKFSMFVADPFYPINLIDATSTVAIILSISGETREIIDIIDKLKQAKCQIISITNTEQCTVARMSDLNFSYYITMHREEYPLDFSTQVPVVYLIEMLGKKVRNRLCEE